MVRSLVVWQLVLCALQHCLVRCGSHQHLCVAIAHAAAHVLRMSNMLLGPIQSLQWVAEVCVGVAQLLHLVRSWFTCMVVLLS